MRPALILPLIVSMLVLAPFPGRSDRGGRIGTMDTGYDVEYPDIGIPEGETLVLEDVKVMVRGSLLINGTLELRNATMTLLDEGQIEHRVRGTLKLLNGSAPGSGSEVRSVHVNGSTDIDLSTGTFVSVDSTLVNLTLSFGDVHISGSELVNCTLYMPEEISYLSGNTFSNGSLRSALELSPFTNWEITGNTFIGYRTAVKSSNGGLKVALSTFVDCDEMVMNGGEDLDEELRLENVVAKDSNLSISNWGRTVIMGSAFSGGRVELMGKPAYVQSSSFEDHDGIYRMKDGIVNGCTFTNCTVALDMPQGSTVLRSRFLGCGTAILDDRDCELYHNAFKGNGRIVDGYVQSLWYNSTLREGNHYDSYTGLDNGQNGRHRDDGIGDTEIPYLGRDYYPLLKDLYWLFPQIPKLSSEHTIGGTRIRLQWDHYQNIRYVVQCSQADDFGKLLAVYSASTSPIEVEAPGNGTYLFRVGAWNEMGYRGWSDPVTEQVDQRPLPPVKISAEPMPEGGEVLLRWEWAGEDLYGAQITYSPEEGVEGLVQVVHPETSTVISGLENGRMYRFFLTSTDHKGQVSYMSSSVEAMPMDTVPPPPPTSLSAHPIDNSAISIRWDPPSDVHLQDLSGFLLYRRGPDDEDFDLIRSFPPGVVYYEDEGLMDNTTYLYYLRSVDDDGPVSTPSETVQVTTLHYNNPPVFAGGSEVIYLKEDGPPSTLDIMRMFSDPDGDRLLASVTDSFPFASEMKDGLLHIHQEPDQSGNGYIQLMVTDGEDFETFLLGVFIEPSPDPPSKVVIQSPTNGSVAVPGSLVLLEGDAYDPDVRYEGDTLTFNWLSDRDGLLSGPGLSVSRMRVQLSPGKHVITMTVTDTKGASVSVHVEVMVSLWGWGPQPWHVELDNGSAPLTTGGGTIRVVLVNNGPLFLTFDCTVTLLWGGMNSTTFRSSVSAPMDTGLIVISAPAGIPPGPLTVEVEASAYTLNGSYAGGAKAVFVREVLEVSQVGNDPTVLILIGGAVIIFLAMVTAYMVFMLLGSKKRLGKRPYGAEDVGSGGS